MLSFCASYLTEKDLRTTDLLKKAYMRAQVGNALRLGGTVLGLCLSPRKKGGRNDRSRKIPTSRYTVTVHFPSYQRLGAPE